MTELVEGVVTQLQPVAKEKDLALTCSAVAGIWVSANANQLTQIVINIIENSIKYSQSGAIHVSLSAHDQEVILKVADQGLGIPLDDQERIFERFYRVEKGRSRESGGTGLGLAIVKHMVEQHAGRITLESTLGIGSTFTVFLPRLTNSTPHQYLD
jgi:two-component system, OmpR family, phosphate regulon sensor histidine kinase PhoR